MHYLLLNLNQLLSNMLLKIPTILLDIFNLLIIFLVIPLLVSDKLRYSTKVFLYSVLNQVKGNQVVLLQGKAVLH